MALRPQYGPTHRAARADLEPIVQAGRARCAERVCWMPDRWIEPGTAWELAHDHRAGSGYLGPAHRTCNRKERLVRHLDDDELIARGFAIDDDSRDEPDADALGFFG